jgi:hypothetical protein
MGLDMYLERAPRYKDTTIGQIKTLEGYFEWKENERAKKYTLKEWCGVERKDLPSKEVRDYYKQHYTNKYYYWDDQKEYGHNALSEHVGYWRKANQIHKWFVDNVQDYEDDCGYYEVDREQLEQLLHICNLIKSKCKLKAGKIQDGYYLDVDGNRVPIMEDGMYIENPAIAQEYLPTQGGFFFGSTDYDEWYMRDIEGTIKILTKVLDETDFDTQMVVYTSSW